MLGRFLALLGGAAMTALAVLLYDPTIYGPDAPSLALGDYETFRALLIFCVAGLALCGLMGAFQPPARSAKKAMPAPRVEDDAASQAAETRFEQQPDAFRLSASPSATPLW